MAEFGIPMDPGICAYREAASLVRKLIAVEPDAIRRLRAIEPPFTNMTPATFERAQLDISVPQILQMLERFVRA